MAAFFIQLVTSILAFLGGNAARVFTVEAMKWVATKGLALALIYVALPMVLYNVLTALIFDMVNAAITATATDTAGLSSNTIALTGWAGWIASQLGVPGMIAQFLTAVSTRFTIGLYLRRGI